MHRIINDIKPAYRDLLDVINNEQGVYPGNLRYYFWLLFNKAKNPNHFFHGLTHTNYVTWICWEAALWCYRRGLITRTEIRILLIAAMMHDFNHSKNTKNDSNELRRAIRALRKYILKSDLPLLKKIIEVMRVTEFPHKEIAFPTLLKDLIRDCDLSQTLERSWMQMILFGLGNEMGKTWQQMLRMQRPFLMKVVHFKTEWAIQKFGSWDKPRTIFSRKMAHIQRLEEIVLRDRPKYRSLH